MNHPDTEKLSDYLDSQLSSQESDSIRVHLDQCAICKNKVANWTAFREGLESANPGVSGGEDSFVNEVMSRIEAADYTPLLARPKLVRKEPSAGILAWIDRSAVVPSLGIALAVALLSIVPNSIPETSGGQQDSYVAFSLESMLLEGFEEESPFMVEGTDAFSFVEVIEES
ncbi:hypothetical protein BVY02_00080 [bacterium J17]|nr:hypothetical protein BVY02_00080 [bacterium J17]